MSLDNSKICWAWAAMALVAVSGGVGGCAREVAMREGLRSDASAADVLEPGQGGAWEAVLASPDVARWHEYTDPSQLESFGRADARLAAGSHGDDINAMAWPTAAAPSLAQYRRLDVRDRDGRIVYFDRERRYESRWRWYEGSRR